MMNIRIEDGYGSAVSFTIIPHEGAAIVDVVHELDMQDCYLCVHDLRDLARAALLTAEELERQQEEA